jgi:isocitrate lyase
MARFRIYMMDMKKLILSFLLLSGSFSAGAALAQGLPDPAQQQAQAQAQINQTLQQTQQNNNNMQYQLQQNEQRQQQQYDAMTPPASQLPAYAPPTPLVPPPQPK